MSGETIANAPGGEQTVPTGNEKIPIDASTGNPGPDSKFMTLDTIAKFIGTNINALSYGADPTGATDSTAAIQAALDAGFSQGINVYIPAGIYKTTAQLNVGAASGAGLLVRGWKVYGDGPGDAGNGGTCIQLYGTGVNAIMQVNSGVWRVCELADFALMTNTAGGATYGLLFNSTQFSQHTVSRIGIVQNPSNASGGPGTAFAVLQGTGVNGEFIRFEDCFASGVGIFFSSNAGQAYMQRFDHCRVQSLNYAGTYFKLSNFSIQGGGLIVTDFNATGTQQADVSNTTLLSIDYTGIQQANSPVIFVGGRVENLTQVFSSPSGQTPGLGVNLSIRGMELGIDFDTALGGLTKTAVFDTSANGDVILVDATRFFANTLTCSFPLQGFQWNSIEFYRCSFLSFAYDPQIIQTTPISSNAGFCAVVFKHCVAGATGQNYLEGIPLTLDLNWELNVSFPGRRTIAPDSAWAQAGVPQNLINHPEIGSSFGASVSPASPWVLSGAANIGLWDWNAGSGAVGVGGNQPRSSSPSARVIYVPHGATLYQDISGIDLSATTYASIFEGVYINVVTWAIQLYGLTNASGYFQIIDSVSGAPYTGQRSFPDLQNYPTNQIITLSAKIVKTSTTSYPRIKIVNTDGSNNLILDIVNQGVFATLNGSLGPMTTAAVYTDEWGSVADNIMARARLQIPSKASAYGAAPTHAQPNLAADIYYDTTTGKITFYDQNTAAWMYLTGTPV